MSDRVQQAIKNLEGTCDSFDCPEDWTDEELNEFDENIFLCDTCGWWFSTDEKSESGCCNECSEDDKEENEE